MFKYYHVYIVDENGKASKYIDTVKCVSEKTAEHQCFMRFGSASKYTGNGRDKFKAVKA